MSKNLVGLLITGAFVLGAGRASADTNAAASTSSESSAPNISGKLEPGIAGPLGAPQSDQFGVGGGGGAKIGVGLTPWLDAQGAIQYYAFHGTKSDTVTITGLGGGVRVQRPHAGTTWSPWVDGDVMYVRTGDLDRAGLSVGGGASFALGATSQLWAGPFVRYLQVVEPNKPGMLDGDARILIGGIGFEADALAATPPPPPAPLDSDADGVPDAQDRCPKLAGPQTNGGCPEPDSDGDGVLDKDDRCPQEAGAKDNGGCRYEDSDNDGVLDKDDRCPRSPGAVEAKGCPDTDGDTVLDPDDQCPKVPGDPDNKGCPRYKQIVVREEKIELSQKIFFAFDQATILDKSFDELDEVARALGDAPKLRVRIEGHTDASGSAEHNDTLSEARAAAVRQYLVDKGVAATRLVSRGYGSRVPLDTNATTAGREKNRRVEFFILRDDK